MKNQGAIALTDMAETYCYIASAHQALFRPGKEGDENKQPLELAVPNYLKSLGSEQGERPRTSRR